MENKSNGKEETMVGKRWGIKYNTALMISEDQE